MERLDSSSALLREFQVSQKVLPFNRNKQFVSCNYAQSNAQTILLCLGHKILFNQTFPKRNIVLISLAVLHVRTNVQGRPWRMKMKIQFYNFE
jgi:hypothetical protein